MLKAGRFYELVVRERNYKGIVLESEEEPDVSIILPRAHAPKYLEPGELITAYVFLNDEKEFIATLQEPKAHLGDLATLKVTGVSHNGAFLDWGMPKELFMPNEYHFGELEKGDEVLVKLIEHPDTKRIIATELLDEEFNNNEIELAEKESVELIVYRKTKLGYKVIINKKHFGLLHFSDVFKELFPGDKIDGFVKKIKEENKIDVVAGKPGHTRVYDEAGFVLDLLRKEGGFLPFHDKSDPDEIYKTFEMSKKTFKMVIGSLYKKKIIQIEDKGIRLMIK